MNIQIKNFPGLVLPSKANGESDACYDLVATSEANIVGESIERPLDRMKLWTRIRYIEYQTNICIAPERRDLYSTTEFGPRKVGEIIWHCALFPRSSISKYNLVVANCIPMIDNGFRGAITVRMKYIFQPEDLIVLPEMSGTKVYGIVNPDAIYNKGDKIIQLLPIKGEKVNWQIEENLPPSQRGEGSFGSSGA